MRLDIIDFPTDSNCELPTKFRELLCAALHRAGESKDAEKVLKAQLVFAAKKLASIPVEQKQLKDAQAKKAAKIKADADAVVVKATIQAAKDSAKDSAKVSAQATTNA